MEKCSDTSEENTEAILAFDTLYTTNHMKILKLLIPYVQTEHQKKLAVFIKWQELIFTLNFFKKYSISLYNPGSEQGQKINLSALVSMLSPYCNESEKNIISQFSQMQNMMNMIQQIQSYMPMIQQFMSSVSEEKSDSNNMNSGGLNLDENGIMDIIKNMMSEEQQTLFSMFMEENI